MEVPDPSAQTAALRKEQTDKSQDVRLASGGEREQARGREWSPRGADQ